MVNVSELKKKAELYRELGTKIFLQTIKNRFYNGKILSIDYARNLIIVKDRYDAEIPIFLKEIHKLEPDREKKV